MKKKRASIEARLGRSGFLFTLPWIIGFICFFLIPLVQSIMFSFSEVNIGVGKFNLNFIGFENFKYIFKMDPDYFTNYKDAITQFVYQVPIIIVLSLALALILNQKFHGRLLARAIFFMPTIIAAGVVMQAFSIDTSATSNMSASSQSAYFAGAIDFGEILMDLGLPMSMTEMISSYISDISTLIWSSGIQIILFISGFQSIPPQLYEVSKVEGANRWEEFWFITFPMMVNVLIVTLAYTIIDVMTSKSNPLMNQAYNLLSNNQIYDRSAAMLWAYFPCIGLIIFLIFFIINKTMVKRWN